MADTADPIRIPFTNLRDRALIGITSPLPLTSDEPIWAGQEFAGYIHDAVMMHGGENELVSTKSAAIMRPDSEGGFSGSGAHRLARYSVTVEIGERPDADDEAIRNPYAHVIWERDVGRPFLDTIPAVTQDELKAINNAKTGKETVVITYGLKKGELEALYRHTIVVNTTPERLIIRSGRRPIRCNRRVARDIRNFWRYPTP